MKIDDSKLFKNLTSENQYNNPNYHSYTFITDNNKGLYIQWYGNFSSLCFHLTTKKETMVVKESFWGGEKLVKEFKYSYFLYYPLYLKEGKHFEHLSNGSYENFKKNSNDGIFNINNDEFEFINKVNQMIFDLISEVRKEYLQYQDSLQNTKVDFMINLDKDGNGEVDLVDGESFNKLLTKNQKSIIEIDKNYIQKFVKISMYLKTKKSNTQKIFDSIKDTKNDTELIELVNLLKNQIHTYDLLVFHSINMITSLVDSNLIVFYEIYECFDQLGVFNSNWENEVSNKLTDIGNGIKDLMYSIYQMENNIVNSIDNLTYVTQDSFKDLSVSVNKQLSSIDSSIKFNNLLTGIQTYQMYKINQNTKRLG